MAGCYFHDPNQISKPFADRNLEKTLNCRVLPEPHHMTSLDYYAIEELLTDEERAACDGARCFVHEEVMPEIVVWERAPQLCN
jgi:hypothetical protein